MREKGGERMVVRCERSRGRGEDWRGRGSGGRGVAAGVGGKGRWGSEIKAGRYGGTERGGVK